MAVTYDEAKAILEQHDQAQVLRFWPQLDGDQRADLLSQIDGLDLDSLIVMRRLLLERQDAGGPGELTPADVVPLSQARGSDALRCGEAALRAGEVGVLLVAGGQGSRLGFDGPKGSFPIAPLTDATLFEIHAKKILALERRYGRPVPFFVMTSRTNDASTRAFFDAHAHFGLAPEHVDFFVQGMWPALDDKGRIILDAPAHIFKSPDGHGGVISALRVSGMLDDMDRRGLRTIFYFQVDNPLVAIADPYFIGLHCGHNAEMSVKVCAKRDAEEGLGVVVRRGGHHAVVEYTELTEAQKHDRLPDGQLRFRFGSVAIHAFSVACLRRMTGVPLPLHVAHKKVPYCRDDGTRVEPDSPNAFKFERFIFDVLPHTKAALNVEFAREDEFSPVKNAAGADSPDTARRDMMAKYARWLEAAGVPVPRDGAGAPLHRIEIDPCFALGPDDLARRLPHGFRVADDVLLA